MKDEESLLIRDHAPDNDLLTGDLFRVVSMVILSAVPEVYIICCLFITSFWFLCLNLFYSLILALRLTILFGIGVSSLFSFLPEIGN